MEEVDPLDAVLAAINAKTECSRFVDGNVMAKVLWYLRRAGWELDREGPGISFWESGTLVAEIVYVGDGIWQDDPFTLIDIWEMPEMVPGNFLDP